MKIGQHVQLLVDMYDENMGYDNKLLVSGEVFEIIEIKNKQNLIMGVTVMKHLKTGSYLNIDHEYGFWCYLNSCRPNEFKIVKG